MEEESADLQPSQMPGGGSVEMDDYDEENEKLESKPGQSMEMEEEQEDILDGYGQEENENEQSPNS